MQVNNSRKNKEKETNQECAPVCIFFLTATDWGLEKRVKDGLHDSCATRGEVLKKMSLR